MPPIGRNITRTILDLSGTPVETTEQTRTPADKTLAFPLTTASKFFIGMKEKFSTRHFNLGTLNTNPAKVTVKYFDGTSFQPVEDVIDETSGFTQNGFLSWINITDWKKTTLAPIDDRELFYVEITVDANLSAGTVLQSVLNIYCDDSCLRSYYPDLITDTRFLPPGRNDFLEQYIAAKDRVILRLKRDQLITDESQIIDINEVSVAATHFAAWIIWNPIARDEGDIEARDEARKNADYELSKVKIDLDWDESGTIDEAEEDQGNIVLLRG